MNNKKILIATGIYPPKIGGPAQYAKNLKEAFGEIGHIAMIKTYGLEGKLPTGIRHLFFFLKIIPSVLKSDAVFALDTFSVGLPAVFACKIFGRKCIIRTGGDFLWEQYLERTKRKILLRNFYNTETRNFSLKDKIIFRLTKWTINNASKIIFSTKWQRDIFIEAYKLSSEKTSIVENYYGEKESDLDYESKTFIASARNLTLKNNDILSKIFEKVKICNPEVSLFIGNLPFGEFVKRMAKSYAVVCASIGEVSPNMILDAIRLNKPFICTKEVGIYDRIKDAGIFIDPLNEIEIERAILNLLAEDGYNKAKEKVKNFNFVHNWQQIAEEFLAESKKL